MTGSDETVSLQPRRAATDWSEPHRCRDRLVFDAAGRRIGHVDGVLRAPAGNEAGHGGGEGEQVFVLVVLGSVARLGNEARAVPADLFVEDLFSQDPAADGVRPGSRYVLRCEADAVRTAPIFVEGRRCACTEWFARVSDHFAAFGRMRQPSGKPPHSSSP